MAVNPQDIIARKEKLATQRQIVERTWEACYDYSYPIRGAGFSTGGYSPQYSAGDANLSTANAKKSLLVDSTSTDSARSLAAALVSGLTPANSRWFELGDEHDEETGNPASRWLDQSADKLWRLIHASNYDSVAAEVALDIVCAGMDPMFIDEDEENGGFIFEQWPLPGCYFAASKAGGPIDTVYRCFSLSAEQAMEEYEGKLSPGTVNKAGKSSSKDEPVEFIHAIYPRAAQLYDVNSGGYGKLNRNLPVASCHVEVEAKHLARESGYHEMPVIVPRWMRVPESVYALGPMYDCLPDVKTLNLQKQYILANMDLATAGMWGAVDDGVLNPKTVRIGPRKIVVMAAKDNMWPLQPATQFEAAFEMVAELQRSIRRTLMADQLEPQDKPGMTATEVHVRVELIRQLLGPVYGRLQREWLQPMVERCFGLAYRAQALGQAPQELQGQMAHIRYVSPMARAQRAVDVNAMDRFEGALGVQAQAGLTDAFDTYDWDAARRERAKLLGVPANLIRDTDMVARIRKAKQQAQQQSMVQGAALQQLSTAKAA